jgi:hypothetical protein
MKNPISVACGIFLALTVLTGCYAQVEDTSIVLARSQICGTPPTCVGSNTPISLTSDFIPRMQIDLGHSGLLTSAQSKQGPLTFETSFILNKATISMTSASDFSGVKTLDFRAVLGNDNCAIISATCQSIATYDSARDGPAGSTLVVKGSDVNLLDFQNANNQVTVVGRGTGNAPAAPTWQADVEMDIAIKGRGSF